MRVVQWRSALNEATAHHKAAAVKNVSIASAVEKNMSGRGMRLPRITSGSSRCRAMAKPFDIAAKHSPSSTTTSMLKIKLSGLRLSAAPSAQATINMMSTCTTTCAVECSTRLSTMATRDTGETNILSTVPDWISRSRLTPLHDEPNSTVMISAPGAGGAREGAGGGPGGGGGGGGGGPRRSSRM